MDRSILLALAAFSFLPSTLPAQTTPVPGKPLVVLSAPFTAQEQTTSSFQAAGGGTVSSFQRVDVARNTAGSTRREPRIVSSPTAQPTGSVFVEIHDAVNRLAIHLNPSSLTATSNILLYSKTTLTAPTILPPGAVVSAPVQNLGVSTVAGFSASGSRQALLFPQGTKSQTHDITETIDTWYSPDLQAVVMTQITDSMNNTTTTTLAQVVQGEPDPSLFTIPQNYATTTVGRSTQSTH